MRWYAFGWHCYGVNHSDPDHHYQGWKLINADEIDTYKKKAMRSSLFEKIIDTKT